MQYIPRIVVIGISGQSIFMNLDHFPVSGETAISNSLLVEPGGKGFNQAVGCARLGTPTRFISAVGDDHYGQVCRHFLENEEVNTQSLKCVTGEKTALAVILTDKRGDNRVTVYPGASLTKNDLKQSEAIIAQSSLILVQLELGLASLLTVLELAKKYSVPVMLNPAPALPLSATALEAVDWLTPNYFEACVLASENPLSKPRPEDLARKIMQNYTKHLVITLGQDGALYANAENQLHIPAFSAGPAIDTTGAGDTFNAALAHAVVSKMPAAKAVHFAVAAAGLSVTRRGVMAALPTLDELKQICPHILG